MVPSEIALSGAQTDVGRPANRPKPASEKTPKPIMLKNSRINISSLSLRRRQSIVFLRKLLHRQGAAPQLVLVSKTPETDKVSCIVAFKSANCC